jgi:hypothetical protein
MVEAKWRPLPDPNQVFKRTYRGETYEMRTVQQDGNISYEVEGQIFRSPTAAARHVTKGEVNGWVFWGIK